MSALDVLSRAMNICGMGRLAPDVASTDAEVARFVSFMNETGLDVSKRGEWNRLYTSLSVQAGVLSVALPDDFQEMAEGGAVVMFDGLLARPVVAPEQWAFISGQPSSQSYYHIRGGIVLFNRNVGGATINYTSTNWVDPFSGSDRDRATANSDQFKIPERLVQQGIVWRWRRQRGLPFDDHLAEYEASIRADLVADRGA